MWGRGKQPPQASPNTPWGEGMPCMRHHCITVPRTCVLDCCHHSGVTSPRGVFGRAGEVVSPSSTWHLNWVFCPLAGAHIQYMGGSSLSHCHSFSFWPCSRLCICLCSFLFLGGYYWCVMFRPPLHFVRFFLVHWLLASLFEKLSYILYLFAPLLGLTHPLSHQQIFHSSSHF